MADDLMLQFMDGPEPEDDGSGDPFVEGILCVGRNGLSVVVDVTNAPNSDLLNYFWEYVDDDALEFNEPEGLYHFKATAWSSYDPWNGDHDGGMDINLVRCVLTPQAMQDLL